MIIKDHNLIRCPWCQCNARFHQIISFRPDGYVNIVCSYCNEECSRIKSTYIDEPVSSEGEMHDNRELG